MEDPIVNDLLKENLARLVSGDSKLEVVTVKNITKQLVAGTRYDITGSFKMGDKISDCVVSMWYRSWLNDANEKVKIKAECGEESVSVKGDSEW